MRLSIVIKIGRRTQILIIASLAIAAAIITAAAVSTQKSGVPLPIIMYHSVLKEPSRAGKYVISPEQVRQDIEYLQENGYTTITVGELIEYVEDSDATLPEKPVIISFDDGYYNNYYYVYPILRELSAKAVISVIGAYSDENAEGDTLKPNYSHMTWEQISEMSCSGLVEIQNHSYDMHKTEKGRLGSRRKRGEAKSDYVKFFVSDVMKMQSRLAEKANIRATVFTYPFGCISPETRSVLAELGFKATFSCEERVNYIKKNSSLFDLGRYNRASGKSSEEFFKRIIQ